MKRLDGLLRFLYDFVVGDDWRIAAGVIVALGLTALLSHASVSAWWVVPVAVAGLLSGSVLAVARARLRDQPTSDQRSIGREEG